MIDIDSPREPEACCISSQSYCPITPRYLVSLAALYCVRFKGEFQMGMVDCARAANRRYVDR